MKGFTVPKLMRLGAKDKASCASDFRSNPRLDSVMKAAESCDGFDAVEELEHALKHTWSLKFGETGTRRWPLSAQIRSEIKQLFPIDCEVFKEADTIKWKIYGRTILLRSITIGIFAGYLLLVAGATVDFLSLYGAVQSRLAQLPGLPGLFKTMPQPAGFMGYLALVSAALVVLRLLVRVFVFMEVTTFGGRFSHLLRERWDEIDTRVTESCLAAQKRGPSWHSRSNFHMIVAAWNAKRAEYLDRYSTMSTWKIQEAVEWAERFATTIKWTLAGGLIYWAWRLYEMHAGLHNSAAVAGLAGMTAIVILTAVLGFLILHRQKNNKWTEVIRSPFKGSEQSKPHFLTMGEVVENLSRTILEVQKTIEDRK